MSDSLLLQLSTNLCLGHREAMGIHRGHHQQIDPCHMVGARSLSAALTPFPVDKDWVFTNRHLKTQEQQP